MPSRGQVSRSCCINIFSCMLQDPHSRQQQQQQPPHPPSSARQQQQQQQRGVRRQDNPWPPAPGITAGRETAARARAECRQAKLGRNCLEKSLAGSSSSSQGLGSAQHNASWRHFAVAFVSSDLCPQPLRSCRCPGAGAGEGEEAGNYSALIYDNIIHRLNVCELVKSGFSVSIPPVLGLYVDSGQ